jgi:hypothetical protein
MPGASRISHRQSIWPFVLLIAIFAVVMGGIIALTPQEGPFTRLRNTSSCSEVVDVMSSANRNAGLAEYARIRYEELGC